MATFYASKTGEVSAREKEHSALVRELAGECMTLLENDGTLPLAGAGKVAVYGNGVRHTVKGGTGSGDVNTRTVVTIEQGLKEAGFEILTGIVIGLTGHGIAAAFILGAGACPLLQPQLKH